MAELPDCDEVLRLFESTRELAKSLNVRMSFHPDQFVVLDSPRSDVVNRSILEFEHQAEVASWIGADVVNIHGGGAYGDIQAALQVFARNLNRLSDGARNLLTVENDEVTYTPADLLQLCRSEGIPLVYDVHHHRCNRDDLSIAEATDQAIDTWNRQPVFHISSTLEGWNGPPPRRHHDFIKLRDFSDQWQDYALTVEVEAKAKELAVLKLMRALQRRRQRKKVSSRIPG